MQKPIGILLGGRKSRVRLAYKLLQSNTISKIILSGKGKQKPTEAQWFYNYLIKKGISKNRLIKEEDSMDTIGNAVYSKKIIIKKKLNKNILLITSRWHVPRSVLLFEFVCGKSYCINGVGLGMKLSTKMRQWISEKRSEEFDKFLLAFAKPGDHKKIEKLIKKYIPRYH